MLMIAGGILIAVAVIAVLRRLPEILAILLVLYLIGALAGGH